MKRPFIAIADSNLMVAHSHAHSVLVYLLGHLRRNVSSIGLLIVYSSYFGLISLEKVF